MKLPSILKLFYQTKNYKTKLRAITKGSSSKFGTSHGTIAIYGILNAILIKHDGKKIDLGILSRRVVTTAGVNYMRDDFNAAAGGADITNFNWHDAGTGTNIEAIGDIALQIPWGGARVSGTQSAPASKQYRTVATITFTGTFAITEHGIFSANAAGTLWDRSVFAAINVVNGDSIQFTYTLTINDGG